MKTLASSLFLFLSLSVCNSQTTSTNVLVFDINKAMEQSVEFTGTELAKLDSIKIINSQSSIQMIHVMGNLNGESVVNEIKIKNNFADISSVTGRIQEKSKFKYSFEFIGENSKTKKAAVVGKLKLISK